MTKTDYVLKIYKGKREFKTIGVYDESEKDNMIKYIVDNPLKGNQHYKVFQRNYYKGEVDECFEIM